MHSNELSTDVAPVTPARVLPIDRGMVPVAEITGRVRRIQEVMRDIMIGPRVENGKALDGVHYGTIPGTPKPTLYQPGAELLCMTFRIAPSPAVEDLSTPDGIRYRVTMRGVSQATGEVLGEGIGECSSDEEKYRWRRPVCDEEFDETPVEYRREKWIRGKSGNFKAKQVRTSPADIANTVLKMAYKRALIAMTRTVLACSDIFAQDLEDLPEELRDPGDDAAARAPIATPTRKAEPAASTADTSTTQAETGEAPGDATHVLEVKTATGINARTKKSWKAYFVTLADGRKAATFSETVGVLAQTAQVNGRPVRCTTQANANDPSKLEIVDMAYADEASQ